MQKKSIFRIASKPDSQDICFAGWRLCILYRRRGGGQSSRGKLCTDGTVLGRHKGITHYTVGQRKGLGLALGYPAFVLEIRPETNEVVIGTKEESMTTQLVARNLNFMSIEDLTEPLHVFTKIRYNSGVPGAPLKRRGKI